MGPWERYWGGIGRPARGRGVPYYWRCLTVTWGGILSGTDSMFRAIGVRMKDCVVLSLIRRSLPNKGVRQAGRTKKECENRVFSR